MVCKQALVTFSTLKSKDLGWILLLGEINDYRIVSNSICGHHILRCQDEKKNLTNW
jgi:hypothetical protein